LPPDLSTLQGITQPADGLAITAQVFEFLCIVLAHREWDEEHGKLRSEGELIVAKQRSGETGAFPIKYDRRTLTFSDVDTRTQRIAEAS
jgi:hypothetical protein